MKKYLISSYSYFQISIWNTLISREINLNRSLFRYIDVDSVDLLRKLFVAKYDRSAYYFHQQYLCRNIYLKIYLKKYVKGS